jgi:hypothetical protein
MQRVTQALLVAMFTLTGTVAAGTVATADDMEDLEQQLAAVTAERDALLAEQDAAATRHDKCRATTDEIVAIVADPAAFGTQQEVLDRLDALAAPGTIYGDAAFGETTWRTGWRNTVYGSLDASIHTWKDWLSDDGSEGGALWTWEGSAFNGEHFSLHGISLFTCDEDGLRDWAYVFYPYEASEVQEAISSGNHTE